MINYKQVLFLIISILILLLSIFLFFRVDNNLKENYLDNIPEFNMDDNIILGTTSSGRYLKMTNGDNGPKITGFNSSNSKIPIYIDNILNVLNGNITVENNLTVNKDINMKNGGNINVGGDKNNRTTYCNNISTNTLIFRNASGDTPLTEEGGNLIWGSSSPPFSKC